MERLLTGSFAGRMPAVRGISPGVNHDPSHTLSEPPAAQARLIHSPGPPPARQNLITKQFTNVSPQLSLPRPRQNAKSPEPSPFGGDSGLLGIYCRQRPTLPSGFPESTIGAGGLNCRVRNGYGCGPTATATGKYRQIFLTENARVSTQSAVHSALERIMAFMRANSHADVIKAKPHEQLVPVS